MLVYTGDREELFQRILAAVRAIVPPDVYTVSHLSSRAFRTHPWPEEAPVCLLIADTHLLDDSCWARLQAYFVQAGKILFVCQNSLCASLSEADSAKKQTHILKSAFGKKAAASGALGKDFEQFMKRAVKRLAKEKEVNETYHARDPVGGYKYSVVLHKKAGECLLTMFVV